MEIMLDDGAYTPSRGHGGEDHEFEAGDKIAQPVVIPVVREPLEQVAAFLPSERGDNGFGSTGR